jgi:hypothetical protein
MSVADRRPSGTCRVGERAAGVVFARIAEPPLTALTAGIPGQSNVALMKFAAYWLMMNSSSTAICPARTDRKPSKSDCWSQRSKSLVARVASMSLTVSWLLPR